MLCQQYLNSHLTHCFCFQDFFVLLATPPLRGSCCWREKAAEDASDVLAPRGLPAAPPAPSASRHQEVGKGERPQGGQAQTHEGQVSCFYTHSRREGHSIIPRSLHNQGEKRRPSQQVGTLQACSGRLLRVHGITRSLRRLPGQAACLRPNLAHVVQAAQASPPGTEPHQNPP